MYELDSINNLSYLLSVKEDSLAFWRSKALNKEETTETEKVIELTFLQKTWILLKNSWWLLIFGAVLWEFLKRSFSFGFKFVSK